MNSRQRKETQITFGQKGGEESVFDVGYIYFPASSITSRDEPPETGEVGVHSISLASDPKRTNLFNYLDSDFIDEIVQIIFDREDELARDGDPDFPREE